MDPRAGVGLAVGALLVWALAIGLGFVLGLLGVLTPLVADWPAPFGSGAIRHVPGGPLLDPYRLFVVVCLVWSIATLALSWRRSPSGTPLKARFGWLTA